MQPACGQPWYAAQECTPGPTLVTLSSLAIVSVVNKTRKSSYLTRSQQIRNGISDGDDMFSFSASNWLEVKMAGKTDIVTGWVGKARRTWWQTQNEDLENFQLRPIVLLNKEHSPKLVGLVGKPPAGDRKAPSSGVTGGLQIDVDP